MMVVADRNIATIFTTFSDGVLFISLSHSEKFKSFALSVF